MITRPQPLVLACGALLVGAACSTLGPTPLTTALPAQPAGRPEVTVQAGGLPGYYLSDTTTDSGVAALLRYAAITVEPDRVLDVPGLVVGARVVGPDHDLQYEPMVGYRRVVGDSGGVALAGFVHGTHASAEDNQASYEATRVGAEVAGDVRLLAPRRWLELHATGGAAAIVTDAHGRYGQDDRGYGVDCPDTGAVLHDADLTAVSPSLHLGLALDLARGAASVVHGGRLALQATIASAPTVVGGERTGQRLLLATGLTLSLAFGSAR
ncbi:MAG: hypothetical protein R2939_04555 [Kofleriaceae bacterium]